MKRSSRCAPGCPLVLALALLLPACRKDSHAHHGHEHHGHGDAHDAGPAPASFKANRGLQLASDTADAIGVKLAPAEERKMSHAFKVTANVFDAGPPPRALTLVPLAIAEALEKNPPPDVKVLSVRRDVSAALTQVEVVLALPGAARLGATIDVRLSAPERTVLSVPRTAILRSATGNFVYVENGGSLLRTAVKIGAMDDEFVEIADGLYAGDVVATAAVEELWLTELRLTKGGGHSH